MARTPPGQTREKVFRYVQQKLMEGTPPTLREVQKALGFRSVESARSHLELLAEEGRLIKLQGKSRGYRLPASKSGNAYLVPLLGQVQAGQLTAAIQQPDGYVAIQAPRGVKASKLFALRVSGESMTGAGILPGDIAIVRQQPTAEPGEIVVALVDTDVEAEATVKTLRRRRGRYLLEPQNPEFETIVPDPDTLQILGKVIEIRRYLEDEPRTRPSRARRTKARS